MPSATSTRPAVRRERTSHRWLLALVALLATVAFSEVAGRWILRGIATTADNSSYFARRWKRANVRKNGFGFRDREWTAKKAGDAYRIAVLGDSFAFGQGIAEKERFSNLLGERLDPSGARFEVLNLGVPGAQTIDELRTLEGPVVELDADFVLLQWYVNDVEGRDFAGRPRPLALGGASVRSLLMPSSVLYFLLDRQWPRLLDALGLVETYEQYFERRYGDPRGPAFAAHERLLERMIEVSRAQRMGFGIVLFPLIAGPDRFLFGGLHDGVLEICRKRSVPCLDLREAFGAYSGDRRDLLVNRFDAHASPLANRIAAEGIHDAFAALWNAPPRAGSAG